MRREVVAIGTQLLLGQIVDTNSSWIGAQLALGRHRFAFPDQGRRQPAADRGRHLLGTRAFRRGDPVRRAWPDPGRHHARGDRRGHGRAPIRDPEIAQRIRALFESRAAHMTENNLRQADVPEGAGPIPQMPGTAPGLVCPVGDKVIYAVPGVPHEMQEMVSGTVLPDLQRRAGRQRGDHEPRAAHLGTDRIGPRRDGGRADPASSICSAIRPSPSWRAASRASRYASPPRPATRPRPMPSSPTKRPPCGPSWATSCSASTTYTMELVVARLLRARGLTLAVAESLTGGLMGARICRCPAAATSIGAAWWRMRPRSISSCSACPRGPW